MSAAAATPISATKRPARKVKAAGPDIALLEQAAVIMEFARQESCIEADHGDLTGIIHTARFLAERWAL